MSIIYPNSPIIGLLGKNVTVTVDRPLGSRHPVHKNLLYTVNYGFLQGLIADDGEEQDAYILGVDVPVELIHELGHSLGNLLDQYPTVAFRHEEMNMESNISVTGKPDEVPWRRFFSVEKYKDKVGIFQHAKNKEYYPSDPQTSKNVMCDTRNEFKYFDSVGRWCIFRNIMWYTDQVVDPEEAWPLFLKYDVVNDDLPD